MAVKALASSASACGRPTGDSPARPRRWRGMSGRGPNGKAKATVEQPSRRVRHLGHRKRGPVEAGRSLDPSMPIEDQLLSPLEAAQVARRSVRTIRRAYRAGSLVAYRDGNGRRVQIRYADLRAWMSASPAARPSVARPVATRPTGRVDMAAGQSNGSQSAYLALLSLSRPQRGRPVPGYAAAAEQHVEGRVAPEE